MGIRAKLFVLTMLITIASLSSMLSIEINYVTKILRNFYTNNQMNYVKSVSTEIDQNINLALSEHSGIFTMILNISAESRNSNLARYIQTNKKFVSLAVLEKKPDAAGYLTQEKAGMHFDAMAVVKNLKLDSSHEIQFFELAKKQLLIIASRLTSPDGKNLLLVSLVKANSIIPQLEWEREARTFILDKNAKGVGKRSKVINKLVAKYLDKEFIAKIASEGNGAGLKEEKDKYILSYNVSSKYPYSIYSLNSLSEMKGIIKKETLRQISLIAVIIMITLLVVYYFSSGFTKNIRKISHRMISAAKGDLETKIYVNSKDEIGKLALGLNWMLHSLKKLTEKEIEFVKTQQELETANLIQSRLMPSKSFETKRSIVSSKSVAMSKCGGDWWSHFIIDDRYECVCIADATGHGPSAAIVTALAYSVFASAKDEIIEFDSILYPKEVLTRMNTLMAKEGLSGITMTAMILLIDHEKSKAYYANGAHLPFFIIRANKVEPYLKSGGIVGMLSHSKFEEYEIDLDGVTRLFFLTDGLVEARNKADRQFGMRRVRKALKEGLGSSGKDLVEKISKSCLEYAGDVQMEDDYTLVVLDIKNNNTRTPKKEEKIDQVNDDSPNELPIVPPPPVEASNGDESEVSGVGALT